MKHILKAVLKNFLSSPEHSKSKVFSSPTNRLEYHAETRSLLVDSTLLIPWEHVESVTLDTVTLPKK